MATGLDAIVDELGSVDRQERIEMLIDFAKTLPPLPDFLADKKDASHRVEECQSPVFLFVTVTPAAGADAGAGPGGGVVSIHADVPIEAPTVRGFVSILIEGLRGATVAEVLQVRNDVIDRIKLPEILGMMRVRGLTGVLNRLKFEVARVAARTPASETS